MTAPSAGHADSNHDPKTDPAALARIQRRGLQVASAVAGVLLGLLGILFFNYRQPLPELTPERFDEARRTWEAKGPASYNIEIQVAGRQSASYRVTVRSEDVVEASRNGSPLKQQRTLGTWSVPGMFETIQVDVDHLRQHRDGTATPEVPNVALHCYFDPDYSYPARYHRRDRSGIGGNSEVSWTVTRFEPLP